MNKNREIGIVFEEYDPITGIVVNEFELLSLYSFPLAEPINCAIKWGFKMCKSTELRVKRVELSPLFRA